MAEQIIRQDFRSVFLDMAAVDLKSKTDALPSTANFTGVAQMYTLQFLLAWVIATVLYVRGYYS